MADEYVNLKKNKPIVFFNLDGHPTGYVLQIQRIKSNIWNISLLKRFINMSTSNLTHFSQLILKSDFD